MPSGIFTYNGLTIDSLIDAKQTIFKTGDIEPNNTSNVNTIRCEGGANKLFVARDT
jgi:hypothetical protein